MNKLSDASLERLRVFARLLDEEAEAAAKQAEALLQDRSDRSLEADGLLCRHAQVVEERGALFGRVRVTFGPDPSRPTHLEEFGVRPGATVRLRERGHDGKWRRGTLGIVVARRAGQLQVVFDDPPAFEDDSRVDLLRSDDDVTLRRLQEAVLAARRAEGSRARLLEVLLGQQPARPTRPGHLEPFDAALHEDQLRAAAHGIFGEDIGLIHGPPGTGKTRVLVEVIRQCIHRGERVLCLTASNAAIDHLAVALLEQDPAISLARAGHPARVHALLEHHTLAGLTERHERRRLAKRLVSEAFDLLRNARKRSARGKDAWRKEREARVEAGKLFADARQLERQAVAEVLRTTQILCGTLTGYERDIPHDEKFDVLVVDEASQALTPALLLGVKRVNRVVLAGDHRQLPPTVISPQAAKDGLATTLFDEWMTHPQATQHAHMLTVQHRMPDGLVAFPSATFYDGKLVAHESVQHASLSDLVVDDNLWTRPTQAFDFIDTAGTGFEEQNQDGGESRVNRGEAELITRLIESFLQAGLKPEQVGVITPYAAQAAALTTVLSAAVGDGLEVDSVDGFQGREKEVIVLSTVRSNSDGHVGFLADPRRLNVAITRARRKLVVVGDSATLSCDNLWNAFFAKAIAGGAHRSAFELPAFFS